MRRLGLSDWSSVAEIIAATGVIFSLIFVGHEIRNNTAATEAATRAAIHQNDIHFLSLRIDSSVLAAAHAKRRAGEELSNLEDAQLIHEQYINFGGFDHTFRQYQAGVISEDEWRRHENIVQLQIQHSEYSRRMWQSSRDTFTPGFQEVVDGFIAD